MKAHTHEMILIHSSSVFRADQFQAQRSAPSKDDTSMKTGPDGASWTGKKHIQKSLVNLTDKHITAHMQAGQTTKG